MYRFVVMHNIMWIKVYISCHGLYNVATALCILVHTNSGREPHVLSHKVLLLLGHPEERRGCLVLDSGGGVGGRSVAWRLAHNLVTPLTGVRLNEREG